MLLLRLPLLLWLSAIGATAVRIGVSREDPHNLTTTATTTPILSTSQMAETSSSSADDNWSPVPTGLNVGEGQSTKFRDFAVPTLPTNVSATTTTAFGAAPTTASAPAATTAKKKTRTYVKTTPTSTPTGSPSTAASTTARDSSAANASTPAAANATQPLAGAAAAVVEGFYCACDLHSSACDLNCCCDADCKAVALQVFDCHAPPSHPELRKRLEDFDYLHGLPSCQVNDGWLCVFRTNTASDAQQQREHQRQQAAMHANHDTTHYHKWPNSLPELNVDMLQAAAGSARPGEANYYKYGAALQMWHARTQEQRAFELPAAFGVSPLCHIRSAVRHLHAERRLCWLPTAAALRLQQSELMALVEDNQLLPQPHVPRDEAAQKAVKWQLQHCLLDDCRPLLLANGSADDLEHVPATRIVLQLQHNYTHVTAATLLLHARPTATADDAQEEWRLRQRDRAGAQILEEEQWRIYEVQFVLNDSTGQQLPPHGASYSGPLGYLQGEAILLARVQPPSPSNATDPQSQWLLDYFDQAAAAPATTTPRQHLLHLFGKRCGLCHQQAAASSARSFIAYGIDTHKTCNMRLSERVTPTNSNYTAICAQLQHNAWSLLFDERFTLEQLVAQQIVISQLGKPQNRSDTWLPLQVLGDEALAPPPIIGVYRALTQTFVCHNVLLSVAYEFQIGAFTLHGQRQQQLITHAALRLGARLDLEFELHERLEVPLSVSVMFYDHAVNTRADHSANAATATASYTSLVNLLLAFSILFCR